MSLPNRAADLKHGVLCPPLISTRLHATLCPDLVTTVPHATAGATGLVGSRLVAKLASQGNAVRVLSRNPDKARNKLQYPRVEFYPFSRMADALKGSDGVINLAGEHLTWCCESLGLCLVNEA